MCGTCHDKFHFRAELRRPRRRGLCFTVKFHYSARCALNRDTFFPGSCAGVTCCLGVPDDSRTEDSTVGGREDGRIGFADGSGNCGFWKEGEAMIVVVIDALPGGGAKDGESIIIMGD